MQVMQAFDIGRKATAILLADFDLVMAQSCFFRFGLWNHHTSVLGEG